MVNKGLEIPVGDDESDENNPDEEDIMQGAAKQTTKEKKQKRSYRWPHKQPPVINTAFSGEGFSLPPIDFDQLSPLHYFQQLWDDNMTQQLVEQTNLYSVQKAGRNIGTIKNEM